jgi:hypothetical protein
MDSKIQKSSETQKQGIHIQFKKGTPYDFQKTYAEITMAGVGVLDDYDAEISKILKRVYITIIPATDLREMVVLVTGDSSRINNLTDLDGVFFVMNRNGEKEYYIVIDQVAYKSFANVITILNHEIQHLSLFMEGKKLDIYQEEIEAHKRSIESLKKIKNGLEGKVGRDNSTVQMLVELIPEEERRLAKWESDAKGNGKEIQ